MKSPAHIEVPGGPNALTSSGLKRSELASTFAADPPGGGLGLSGARHVADIAFHGRMARALLHGWGMYNKHAIERYLARPEASWMSASYWWPCRLVLAGGAVIILSALLSAALAEAPAGVAISWAIRAERSNE